MITAILRIGYLHLPSPELLAEVGDWASIDNVEIALVSEHRCQHVEVRPASCRRSAPLSALESLYGASTTSTHQPRNTAASSSSRRRPPKWRSTRPSRSGWRATSRRV